MSASRRVRTGRGARQWAGVSMGIAATTYFLAPRLLKRAFAPPQRDSSTTPADLGLPQEQVWLTSASGHRLHGWLIRTEGRAPAVVVVHGWGGNSGLMLPLAPHLHEAGFHTFFLDARNHGRSEHDSFSSMPRFAEDLDTAVEWLRARTDVTSVGVVGHSVGAGAAILSAANGGQADAVVSVSAPAHPGDMMREHLARIPKPVLALILNSVQRIIGHRFDAFAPRNRIAEVKVPVMLVHGSADKVVPITNLHELTEAKPDAEVLVVSGAGHSDLDAFANHIGDIKDFFDRHLPR